MSGARAGSAASPFKQPKAVWAVAFACVVSFMGIGLVDPILPAISHELHASPSEVTLLFTSYLVVTAVAMLITNWVSSRIGAKRTLIAGLVLIVVFSALAGASPTIGAIIGFRAGWGLGNALFIATSLAVIVASASGGFAGAIILYETALGVGIAIGPLLGGMLGEISWRGPFFGVSALMAIALIATVVLVEQTPKPAAQDRPVRAAAGAAPPRPADHGADRALLQLGLLHGARVRAVPDGPEPDQARPGVHRLGHPGRDLRRVRRAVAAGALGIARTMYVNLAAFAVVVLVIAIWTTDNAVLIPAVIMSGIFIGINNTVTTQAVMTVSPVERPVASAAYSFVRFIGGGLAPYVAGRLVIAVNIHVPFYIAAGAIVLGIVILTTGHRLLAEAERVQAEQVTGRRGRAGQPRPSGRAHPSRRDRRNGRPGRASSWPRSTTHRSPGWSPRPRAGWRPTTAVVHVVHAQERRTPATRGRRRDPGRGPGAGPQPPGPARRAPRPGRGPGPAARGRPRRGRADGRRVRQHVGATTIVIGAPTHGGLPALMDASASRELWRHARSNILIINPAAPAGVPAEDLWGELAKRLIADGDHHGTPRSAPSWASNCCLRSTPPANPRRTSVRADDPVARADDGQRVGPDRGAQRQIWSRGRRAGRPAGRS